MLKPVLTTIIDIRLADIDIIYDRIGQGMANQSDKKYMTNI